MKTRNLAVWALAVIFCGAFWCADSLAGVCFLPSDCDGQTTLPSDDYDTEVANKCNAEGYNNTECEPGDRKVYCPYSHKWWTCCGKEFRYTSCASPLEKAGDNAQCGGFYKCKCGDEYVVNEADVKNNNCHAYGVCSVYDKEADKEVNYYKECTCDTNVYADITIDGEQCRNNQDWQATCKSSGSDEDGNVVWQEHNKCYCDRNKYPVSYCAYGHVGEVCIDSSTRREYYKECKSGEALCEESENPRYYTSCADVHDCQTEVEIDGETQTLTSEKCIPGELCPYSPKYHQCVFDKATWCIKNGYTSESDVEMEPSQTCTHNNVEGTAVLCPANDGLAKFYYRCKLSCEKLVRASTLWADSGNDPFFVDPKGVKGSLVIKLDKATNGFRKGYHLFIAGNQEYRLPESGRGVTEHDYNLKSPDGHPYASINGISALYKLYPDLFADCKDDYNDSDLTKNPTIIIPLNGDSGDAANSKYTNPLMFSRDLHNVNIKFSYYGDDGKSKIKDEDFYSGDWYNVLNAQELQRITGGNSWRDVSNEVVTYVWSNVRMSIEGVEKAGNLKAEGWSDADACVTIYTGIPTINLKAGVKLKFMGKIQFELPAISQTNALVCHTAANDRGIQAARAGMAFRTSEYGIIEFDKAKVELVGDSVLNDDLNNADNRRGYKIEILNGNGKSSEKSNAPDFIGDCDTRENWNRDGVMVIKNGSEVFGNNHAYCLHLDMDGESKYTVMHMWVRAIDYDTKGNWSEGLQLDKKDYLYDRGSGSCRGIALRNKSELEVLTNTSPMQIRKYLYMSDGSSVMAHAPVRLALDNNDLENNLGIVCLKDEESHLDVQMHMGHQKLIESGYQSNIFRYRPSGDYAVKDGEEKVIYSNFNQSYQPNQTESPYRHVAKKYRFVLVDDLGMDRTKRIMYSGTWSTCIPYHMNWRLTEWERGQLGLNRNANAEDLNPWLNGSGCNPVTKDGGGGDGYGQEMGDYYTNYNGFGDRMTRWWGNPNGVIRGFNEPTMYTPGEFKVHVSKSMLNIVKAWEPPYENGVHNSCRNNGDQTENGHGIACGRRSDNLQHAYFTDGANYYYRMGNYNGKCVDRDFLCSGCSYCDSDGNDPNTGGIGHLDWNDSTGGLTEGVDWSK